MKRQGRIGVVTLAHRLKRRESSRVLLIIQRRLGLMLRLRLQALLELSDGWSIKGGGRKNAGLESTTIEAWTVRIEALANDLAAANND